MLREVLLKAIDFASFMLVVYNWVFFIWIIASWLPINRSILIMQFVDNLVNPVYNRLLSILPPLQLGMMDFSPFYMFIFLTVLDVALQIMYNMVLQFI